MSKISTSAVERRLDRQLKQDVVSVAGALFASSDGPPPAARLSWLADEALDFVKQAGPRTRLILTGGLWTAIWLAPLTIRTRPPLKKLPLADQWEALHRLEQTKAGLPVLAVKAILCIIYYEHPDVLKEIGVDTGCMKTAVNA